MENVNKQFLLDFKQYLTSNYEKDCKYGYGWLLEKKPEIESMWFNQQISEIEYTSVMNNYETLMFLINKKIFEIEKNECC